MKLLQIITFLLCLNTSITYTMNNDLECDINTKTTYFSAALTGWIGYKTYHAIKDYKKDVVRLRKEYDEERATIESPLEIAMDRDDQRHENTIKINEERDLDFADFEHAPRFATTMLIATTLMTAYLGISAYQACTSDQ